LVLAGQQQVSRAAVVNELTKRGLMDACWTGGKGQSAGGRHKLRLTCNLNEFQSPSLTYLVKLDGWRFGAHFHQKQQLLVHWGAHVPG
jgi:hypothetical protein